MRLGLQEARPDRPRRDGGRGDGPAAGEPRHGRVQRGQGGATLRQDHPAVGREGGRDGTAGQDAARQYCGGCVLSS